MPRNKKVYTYTFPPIPCVSISGHLPLGPQLAGLRVEHNIPLYAIADRVAALTNTKPFITKISDFERGKINSLAMAGNYCRAFNVERLNVTLDLTSEK